MYFSRASIVREWPTKMFAPRACIFREWTTEDSKYPKNILKNTEKSIKRFLKINIDFRDHLFFVNEVQIARNRCEREKHMFYQWSGCLSIYFKQMLSMLGSFWMQWMINFSSRFFLCMNNAQFEKWKCQKIVHLLEDFPSNFHFWTL